MTDNKYWLYLESLRKSGETNMYGATPYLEDEFHISHKEATIILSDWMDNYNPSDYSKTDKSEVKHFWVEIRNDYRDDDIDEQEDIVSEICIDAWKTGNDDEEGCVIAKIIKTKSGDVGIVYIDNVARVDEMVQEKIKEAVKMLREE